MTERNHIKDLIRNISDIKYNILNLPNQVIFTVGNSMEYEYKGDGTRLLTVHKTGEIVSKQTGQEMGHATRQKVNNLA